MIANTSKLRLLALRRTTSGNQADRRELDLPIVAWVERDGRPWPVVVASLDDTDVLRIFDPDTKTWFSMSGQMFTTFAQASAEAWEPTKPEPVGLTVPGVGPVGLAAGDHWGTGQTPIGHRPTSGPRSPSRNLPHPRDRQE